MQSVAWLAGLRYSGSRSGRGYLSFISRVALAGLTLGVVALVVVVSVMNGFDRELKYRILGAAPHVVVETTDPAALTALLAASPYVAGYARFMRRAGVVVRGPANKLVTIYGIDPGSEHKVSIIPDHMDKGGVDALEPGANRILVGRPLGLQLGIGKGEILTLIIPEPSAGGQVVIPRMTRVEVGGFFELDSELDYQLVVMRQDDLAAIVDDRRQIFRVTLKDIFRAQSLQGQLMAQGSTRSVTTWAEDYGDFFRTVRMEKIMMFILLTLVVAIAAFNIVSGLSMMVKQKMADIAVFRTLGLPPASIMQIFVVQGAMVGVLGTVLGLLIGVPLAFAVSDVVAFFEQIFGGRMLAGTYFDRIPSDVRIPDLIVIAVVSLAISLVATLYPAYRAARVRPADVLRYE